MDSIVSIDSKNPIFPEFTTLGATLHTPANVTSRSIAIIVHGHAGHRDYCYQKLLAHALPIFSLRFDFSGCGAQLGQGTQLGKEEEQAPRTFDSDMIDLKTIINYARSQDYFVAALVGHSRGAIACMQYAKQDSSIHTVVNCSGRYRAHLIWNKIRDKNLHGNGPGYWEKQRAGSGGPLVNKYTLLKEIESVGNQEMDRIAEELDEKIDVLTVFGTRDTVIPVSDAALWSNALQSRMTLHLVDDADHNFFITEKGMKENKNPEVAQYIAHYLSDECTRLRFVERSKHVKLPRWQEIDGTLNLRDLGGYGTFPAGLVYRSADLSALSEAGAHELSLLVNTIFDVRSNPEVKRNGTTGPQTSPLDMYLAQKAVTRMHVPIFAELDYTPNAIAKRLGYYKSGLGGFVKAYRGILANMGPTLARIFNVMAHNIRTRCSRGVLIHCSAGKDRTGLICALLLLLAGVDEETVAREYELTTHGLARHHQRLLATIGDAAGNLEEEEGIKHMMGSKSEAMRMTIRIINREFGGVNGFLSELVDPRDLAVVGMSVRGKRVESVL